MWSAAKLDEFKKTASGGGDLIIVYSDNAEAAMAVVHEERGKGAKIKHISARSFDEKSVEYNVAEAWMLDGPNAKIIKAYGSRAIDKSVKQAAPAPEPKPRGRKAKVEASEDQGTMDE